MWRRKGLKRSLKPARPHDEAMLTLYGAAECHESARVRRLLRQEKIPFKSVIVPCDDRRKLVAEFGAPSVPGAVDGKWRSQHMPSILRHVRGLTR